MFKWFALILVASVLCWGDTNPVAGGHEASEKNMEKALHPIDEGKTLKEQDAPDALTLEDKIELDKLLEELNELTPDQNQTGEKAEKSTSNSSNL